MLVFVSMVCSYCLASMQTLSAESKLYLLAPAGPYLPPVPQGVKGDHTSPESLSVTLSVAGNSHKEAELGDKMFYFKPQSVASKWQDSLILSLDLVSDVSCGWADTRAIAAARRVSERCSLGAEARSALQNFACTVPGEKRRQSQPIRSQY